MENDSDLLDAASNFVMNALSLCNTTTPNEFCIMPDPTTVLQQDLTDGVQFSVTLDYSKLNTTSFFSTYQKACLNAGGKFCYGTAAGTLDFMYYNMLWDATIVVTDSPSCYAPICNEAEIGQMTKSMTDMFELISSAYYEDIEINLNVTGITCN